MSIGDAREKVENDTGNDPITDGDIAEVTSDDVAPSPSYLSKDQVHRHRR